MKRSSIKPYLFLVICVLTPFKVLQVSALIIDHHCTYIGSVPMDFINTASSNFRIFYGHTSHGGQITTGMENLQNHYGASFAFNSTGSGGVLAYEEYSDDLGHNGDVSWATVTRNRLNEPGNDRNVVMWSWCGGVSDNTEEGINTYLNAMNQLETDHPEVMFIYMTGHLDGSGESGNLNQRNHQIRNYCQNNGKILFDFADIESYDPDGNNYLPLNADDDCNYDGGNWAEEWCADHPGSELCWNCDCAHSRPLNCNLKGCAFWWMMARMAGWGDTPSTPTPVPSFPTSSPTPAVTPTPFECVKTGVIIDMPSLYFKAGDTFYIDLLVCIAGNRVLSGYPLFCILDVYGECFFAPSFTDFDFYGSEYGDFAPGITTIQVVPATLWPKNTGSASEIHLYTAFTDPGISHLYGSMDTKTFGWGF